MRGGRGGRRGTGIGTEGVESRNQATCPSTKVFSLPRQYEGKNEDDPHPNNEILYMENYNRIYLWEGEGHLKFQVILDLCKYNFFLKKSHRSKQSN